MTKLTRLAASLTFIAIFMAAHSQKLPLEPDFAFPQNVIADAEKVYKTSAGLPRMQAAMQIAVARTAVNPDSTYTAPAFIAATAASESDPAVAALLRLYEARLLAGIYSADRWKYDRATTPDLPLPADVRLWSGAQFRSQVGALTDSAFAALRPYYSRSVSDYSAVVKADAAQRRLYPSLLDFAASAARANLSMVNLPSDAPARVAMDATPAGSLRRAVWLVKTGPGMDALIKAYEAEPAGDGAAYLLYNISYPEEQQTVGALRAYLKDNTSGELVPMLRGRLASLTQPTLRLSAPPTALPGRPVEIEANHKYTDEVGVVVYRVTNPRQQNSRQQLKEVARLTADTDSLTVGKVSLSVTFDNTGYYVLKPMVNGKVDSSRWQPMRIFVTGCAPLLLSENGENLAILADFASGAPISGAALGYYDRSKGVGRNLGVTDSDGSVHFSLKATAGTRWQSYPLTARVGKTDYFFDGVTASTYFEDTQGTRLQGRVYLNRPLYRPGEKAGWSVTVVRIDPARRSSILKAGLKLNVVLRDANYENVDTVSVTTDSYGRAFGSFDIPVGRLTGDYSVHVLDGDTFIASSGLMVSDYKAPVFEVTDLETVRGADGSVSIAGRAVTYAGMPVAGARVSVGLREMPRWRWWWFAPLHDAPSETLEVVTDADGRFKAVAGVDILDDDTDYMATVDVTSAAAETASGQVPFTTGKPYTMQMGDLGGMLCSDSPARVPVSVYGPDGSKTTLAVGWTLSSSDFTMNGRGDITPDGGLTIDIDSIPAGVYTLSLVPCDTAQCEAPDSIDGIAVYSIRRNVLPASSALLLPTRRYECAPGSAAEVLVGVGCDQYVYLVGCDRRGPGKPVVRRLETGFHRLPMPLAADSSRTEYTLMTIADGRQHITTVDVEPIPEASLRIEATAMRDRLTPGGAERWQLRVSRTDGLPVDATMLATMYNHSLDALYGYSWPADLPRFTEYVGASRDMLARFPVSTYYSLPLRVRASDLDIAEPQFRYLPGYGLRIRGGRMLKGMVRGVAVVEECVEVSNDCAVSLAAAPAPAPGAVGADMEMEEAAADGLSEVVTVAGGIAVDSGAANGVREAAPSLRSGFVAQAFWLPDIKVEADGSAIINFTVPDAVTTWRFKAVAWDTDLRVATLNRDLVASKPLMVQPNLPRFVRDGDRVQVIATVYNNTDSAMTAQTRVEFFDPATGRVLAPAVTSTDSIAASGAARVAAWLDVPAAASMVGYRVVSSAGGFTDGEQVPVPVLPSGATVVDTENFVLTSESPVFETRIPGGQDITALQYCQNPLWDVVRALPDLLSDHKAVSSPQAAQLLYGALTAGGLRDRYPELRQVIDTWAANPADSALVSDLSRNEDIKLALLAQTPWVQAAASNNERMARLTAVFDRGNIRTATDAALATLEKMQGADGGFRWGTWSDDASLWATTEVVWGIGHARMQGDVADGSRADRIARRALGYCDRWIDKDDTGYALLLAFYPGYEPTTLRARTAVSRGVQQMLKDWRDVSTAVKARYALALYAHGYKAVAAEVMESVRQHEVTDRYGCITFPSVRSVYDYAFILQAFARISPRAAELDGIRRGLVLRTSVSDDLGTSYPAPIIAAILATGSQWTSLADTGSAAITVDGRPLDIDRVQYATGAVSTRLPASDAGKTLRVERAASGPVSYGSLTTVGTRPMTDVPGTACPQLSVGKRTLVERDGNWVEPDTLRLGERVRVELIVYATVDLDYVTITDERAAALEPVDQLPGYVYDGSLGFYREPGDSRTRLFVTRLPRGTYRLTYDMTAAAAGEFASGLATVQSQYAPEVVAHSAGCRLRVAAD